MIFGSKAWEHKISGHFVQPPFGYTVGYMIPDLDPEKAEMEHVGNPLR